MGALVQMLYTHTTCQQLHMAKVSECTRPVPAQPPFLPIAIHGGPLHLDCGLRSIHSRFMSFKSLGVFFIVHWPEWPYYWQSPFDSSAECPTGLYFNRALIQLNVSNSANTLCLFKMS